MDYTAFLKAKVCVAKSQGFVNVSEDDVSPIAKPHQRRIVPWMVNGGRRALFASFGLGKSVCQLEAVRLTRERAGGRGLIVCPLGVRQEFKRDAVEVLHWETPPQFIRSIAEASDDSGIYLTNYETVRDGKLDPRDFSVVSLDEAAVLRGFGGVKTFRTLMRLFAGDGGRGPTGTGRNGLGVPYRFVATATPSPNDYIELLSYAAYLGVMEVSEAKTRFFKRNSEKADQLTLQPHKEEEFWLWVSSWALFVQKPSDIDPSFSDEGYVLPPLDVRWHEIKTDHNGAGEERDGQQRMFRNAAIGVQDAAREKRDSLPARLEKMMELRAEDPAAHRILWHDLEREREAIEDAIPSSVSIYGSQDLEEREQAIIDFSDGKFQELAAKPVIAGSGCNFQRHCSWAIFLGIGFKFNDFIQAIHRIHRFLQQHRVRIDLIYTEAEREVKRVLERKWQAHERMVDKMTELIREHGLSNANIAQALQRSLGVERIEVSGANHRMINGDSAEELKLMPSNSVGLVVTSIPFGNQYEYSPSLRDLGHTTTDAHFFEHLGYITRELYRVVMPGRIVAVHVKDRIVPGGINGHGFQTVNRFSDKTCDHFESHGFAFLARKTIVTDVVRENNATYRLGWSEQCKDGSRMGAGMPEYVLLFRKPPTDSSDGYADIPVVKSKKGYSRSRWQIDAHGFARSNGNRHLTPEEIEDLPHDQIFKLYRRHSLEAVYDFEHHVKLGEALEIRGRLPVTFMLLQPQSWHEDVWTDVARMRTLNMTQASKGKESHLCPLQFDIVDRLIAQCSNPGETVLDPFAGLGTVPMMAVKMGRKGLGVELSPDYFLDAVAYCEAAEQRVDMPTLFDLDSPEDLPTGD